MLSHNNLALYYQKIFAMAQHHKYSITEIESMMPYERDVYFSLLINFIEEKKKEEHQRSR
jgi:DNA replication initiation complex subunit (GINS family)